MFASTLMRGEVKHWIKPFIHKHLNDELEEKDAMIIDSIIIFKKKIWAVLDSINDKQVAVRVVQTLRQKSSAADYNATFQEYV